MDNRTKLLKAAAEKISREHPEFIGFYLHLIAIKSDSTHREMADMLECPTLYNYYMLCLCLEPDSKAVDFEQQLGKICLYCKCNKSKLKIMLAEHRRGLDPTKKTDEDFPDDFDYGSAAMKMAGL